MTIWYSDPFVPSMLVKDLPSWLTDSNVTVVLDATGKVIKTRTVELSIRPDDPELPEFLKGLFRSSE
jgi:hypothetical protein